MPSSRILDALTVSSLKGMAGLGFNGLNPDFTIDYGQGVHPQRSMELAEKMYGLLGIAREDKKGRTEFVRENLRFFGAPYSALMFIPPMGDRIRAAFDQGTAPRASGDEPKPKRLERLPRT